MDNLNLNLYDKKKNIISSNYAYRNNDYFSNSFYGGGYHFDMKLKTKSNTNKYLNTSNISNCSTNSNLTNIKIKTERVLRRTNSALNIDSYESSKKNKDYSLFDGNRFNDGQNLNTSKLQLDKLKKEYYTNIQSDRQRSNSKESIIIKNIIHQGTHLDIIIINTLFQRKITMIIRKRYHCNIQ